MKGIFILACIVLAQTMNAQLDTANRVKYTSDFKFKEGFFLNFDQVKENKPIPKSRIITTIAYDDPDFFDRVLQNKKIEVFGDLGEKTEYQVDKIWGYSRNGILFINLNDGFYRITLIGSISHFVAAVTTQSGYNPYAYPNGGYYSYNPYYSPYGTTESNEMRQYLLDFKTGNVLEYSVESVEVLLMSDPQLHDEFMALSKKEKKQFKFVYIRKFNDKNPLYFPEN